jgi:hypothetical protein
MPYPGVQNFDGYPLSVGGKRLALAPNGHAGPASYVQATTTGDPLQAAEFGLKYIDAVLTSGVTSNGTYTVRPVNPTDGPVQSVKLAWYVTATGAEVAAAVNLSASKVNLLVIGT